MPVHDLARSEVVTATKETAVSEIAQTMGEETIGSVVITEDNKPVGIITDRDLALRCVAAEGDTAEQTADNVMSENLETVNRTAGFYEAVERMSDRAVRRLPVTDENDELVGILTSDDLTTLLADEQQGLSEVIEAQRSPYDE
jgi:CBS domain-containing protein